MAVKCEFTHKGLRVQVWGTSYRIEGMSEVIHVGKHITERAVCQQMDVIFSALEDKAIESAAERLKSNFIKVLKDKTKG